MTTIERVAAPVSTSGTLPRGWKRVPLGKVLTQYTEYIESPDAREYPKLSVKLYGRGVVMDTPADGASLRMQRHQLAKAGQVILSEIWGKKGAIGIVPPEGGGALCTSHFFLFDIQHDRMDPRWLQAIFSANYLQAQLDSEAHGTTGYAAVRPRHLFAAEIPLPPLDEQRRIVARIEALAARIAEARELRREAMAQAETLLDAARAGVFQPALERSSSHLRMVAMLERGRFSHRPRNDPMFFGGAHPWIQIGEIEASGKYIRHWTDTLNDVGLAVSRKFPKGTLLISIAATIGAVGILDFACCVPDSIVGVTPTAESDGVFLYHYLGYLRRHLEQVAPQSAQKNINLEILASLPVPVLSAKEQTRIAAYLDDVEEQANELTQHQEEAAEAIDVLLPAVLDRAFRGEL